MFKSMSLNCEHSNASNQVTNRVIHSSSQVCRDRWAINTTAISATGTRVDFLNSSKALVRTATHNKTLTHSFSNHPSMVTGIILIRPMGTSICMVEWATAFAKKNKMWT